MVFILEIYVEKKADKWLKKNYYANPDAVNVDIIKLKMSLQKFRN